MDTSVATQMLDGAFLSGSENADKQLYVNQEMKVAVEQWGSLL